MKASNGMTIDNAFKRMTWLIMYMNAKIEIVGQDEEYVDEVQNLMNEICDVYYVVTGNHANYKTIIKTLGIH